MKMTELLGIDSGYPLRSLRYTTATSLTRLVNSGLS